MDNCESALVVRFGRFLLDAHRRELLADGVPVTVGGRAFDILLVLVEAGGRLVSKDELLSRVWPGRFVEENCLQFHISTLRKALAPDRDFIKTIAGRGYRFIADLAKDVDEDPASCTRPEGAAAAARAVTMSAPVAPDVNLAALVDLVTAPRLAAVVGVSDIDGAGPGTESERRLLLELANGTKIVAPGPSSCSHPLFPALGAVLRDGAASSVATTSERAPKRLLLLLSIDA